MSISRSATNAGLNSIGSFDGFSLEFTNGGSDNLNVDGSITPVEFTLEDKPAGDLLLNRVTFGIGTDEILDLNNFGDRAELVNGLLFVIDQALGNPGKTIRSNGDVLLTSSGVAFQSTRIQSVTKGVLFGALDYTDVYGGNGIIANDGDVKLVVRDDLSTIPFFKVTCQGIVINDN